LVAAIHTTAEFTPGSFRVAEGKVKELTEYMDTELVTAALADPSEMRVV
jgi:hypothetical protein